MTDSNEQTKKPSSADLLIEALKSCQSAEHSESEELELNEGVVHSVREALSGKPIQ